jgi:FKBP-type peptidyl-prolyl cis-trans isomerase 2
MWKAKIVSVTWDKVKVDFNHFLAWKKLIFDVELVEFKN